MLSTYLQFAHLIIPNLYLWSPPFFVALLEFHDNPWLPSPPGLSSSALSSSRNHQEEFLPLHTLCCKDDKRKRVSFSIMLMKNDVTEWFPWWVDLFFPSWGKREKEKGENIILREDKAERMQSAWSSQQNHLWLRYGILGLCLAHHTFYGTPLTRIFWSNDGNKCMLWILQTSRLFGLLKKLLDTTM